MVTDFQVVVVVFFFFVFFLSLFVFLSFLFSQIIELAKYVPD